MGWCHSWLWLFVASPLNSEKLTSGLARPWRCGQRLVICSWEGCTGPNLLTSCSLGARSAFGVVGVAGAGLGWSRLWVSGKSVLPVLG